jgi:DNA-binding transcriptional regulator YdaS (Cro superfamily)
MGPLLDTPLIAYPTLTEAARLLAVSASTLSRRDDLRAERMGERDRRLPAGEVMRLAALYRKRSLNEVAADVVDYAAQHAPKQATAVEGQIEAFFAEHQAQALKGAFLDEARRALPDELYREVERVYQSDGETPPALVSAD